MKFIKHNCCVVFQHRIVLDQAGEDALSHHFDLRGGSDLAVQSGAIADALPNLFAQLLRHKTRCRTRSQTPRF